LLNRFEARDRKGAHMANNDAPKRNDRTKRDIKRALLELLASKPLDSITMSELAREAQVSRSTLYQHYNNTYDAYEDIVRGFHDDVSPIMSEAACFDGIEPPGTRPFCDLIRDEEHRAIVGMPGFLDTYMQHMDTAGNNEFISALASAGYRHEICEALSVFQMNGCFNAAKKYGHDEALWREVREAIDTFICGGLSACQNKRHHQLLGAAARKRGMRSLSD